MNLEDVQKILAIVEDSHFTEIDLQVGDVHIVARKGGAEQGGVGGPTRTGTQRIDAVSGTAPVIPSQEERTVSSGEEFDGHLVRAPMVGTFYRAPSPGAEPFAVEGDVVQPSTTLGSLEVMKLFNSVDAGISGTVIKFLVENGDLVEFDQPLVLIEPAQP